MARDELARGVIDCLALGGHPGQPSRLVQESVVDLGVRSHAPEYPPPAVSSGVKESRCQGVVGSGVVTYVRQPTLNRSADRARHDHGMTHARRPSTSTTKIARADVSRAKGRTKVRKTLTLDPELVMAFGDAEGGLSAAVNGALREHLARMERQDALATRIAELEAECGPADPADVERFARHMR